MNAWQELKKEFLQTLRDKAIVIGVPEIAKATGIPRSHVYKILSDEGNPTLEIIIKISIECGVVLKLCLI